MTNFWKSRKCGPAAKRAEPALAAENRCRHGSGMVSSITRRWPLRLNFDGIDQFLARQLISGQQLSHGLVNLVELQERDFGTSISGPQIRERPQCSAFRDLQPAHLITEMPISLTDWH
ncbi:MULTISPECIES: hypothetical protein [Pseudomonas]|uniref:hypothetical protein n=1 Tax=Pseudomonas TaxID=286 RepID=UPI00135B246D|nr:MULTISPECIES: hypothetical protein [unclassified Pseudomonas]MDD2063428.1 hypothetical protein [Pseudomonas sp. 25571]